MSNHVRGSSQLTNTSGTIIRNFRIYHKLSSGTVSTRQRRFISMRRLNLKIGITHTGSHLMTHKRRSLLRTIRSRTHPFINVVRSSSNSSINILTNRYLHLNVKGMSRFLGSTHSFILHLFTGFFSFIIRMVQSTYHQNSHLSDSIYSHGTLFYRDSSFQRVDVFRRSSFRS